VLPGPVEVLAQGPARVDPAHRPLRRSGLTGKPAATHVLGCGLQRRHQGPKEHAVVDRRPGGTADDDRPLDRLRKERCPVISLDPAHGPAIDAGQPVDAQMLREEPALETDVVGDRHEARVVRCVRGARRQAIAEHVRDDDEPARWIDDAIGPDQPLEVRVLGGIAARIEDDVVVGRRERAVGLPGQAGVAQHLARGQWGVASLEDPRLRPPVHVRLGRAVPRQGPVLNVQLVIVSGLPARSWIPALSVT
jgi:hypothetical protein